MAAKGTDLATTAGKEDPVELDSSLILLNFSLGVVYGGAPAQLKHPNQRRSSTYTVINKRLLRKDVNLFLELSGSHPLSVGEVRHLRSGV